MSINSEQDLVSRRDSQISFESRHTDESGHHETGPYQTDRYETEVCRLESLASDEKLVERFVYDVKIRSSIISYAPSLFQRLREMDDLQEQELI